MEKGNFSTLHNWLIGNIYQYGRKYTAAELIERVTGSPLSIEPFIRYIQQKSGELYARPVRVGRGLHLHPPDGGALAATFVYLVCVKPICYYPGSF